VYGNGPAKSERSVDSSDYKVPITKVKDWEIPRSLFAKDRVALVLVPDNVKLGTKAIAGSVFEYISINKPDPILATPT